MINIKLNSREVTPNDTFVAIKGSRVDGHNYVEDAIKRGATTVVVSNGKKYSVNTINVDDTMEYLINTMTSNYAKEVNKLKIVGITGTNGKTTTAFMTYQLLRKLNIKAACIGTIGFFYNDKFEPTINTTPDIIHIYNNLLKAKEEGCKIVLLEASSIGIVSGRLSGIKYDLGVFTNLTHDHLDYHKTMKAYLNAKLEMFKYLKPKGKRIVNIDDRYGKYFCTKDTLTYGFHDSDIKCISHNKSFSSFKYVLDNKVYEIDTQLFGKYNVYNVMASILILKSLGIKLDKINKTYKLLEPPKGRINVMNYNNNKIIVDYAHTPDGMQKVLTSVKNITNGKLYVVFGCTGDRDFTKRPIMGKLAQKYADYFIVTNDDPHYEDEQKIANDVIKKINSKNYKVILDRKKAINNAFKMLKENDTLLILGKGHEGSIIIKDKAIPFSDIKYVEELINKEKV